MNKKKRSLSESSDDPDDPGVFDPSPGSGYNPLAGGYNPSAGDYSSSGGLPGFKRPKFESSGRVYPFNFFANIPFKGRVIWNYDNNLFTDQNLLKT